MLLRRIATHLKSQNWFAVALDLIIVVVGVFIGVQAANWNEARERGLKSAEYSERLRNDLKRDHWIYAETVQYHREVLASAEEALAALEGEIALSDAELLASAYRATQTRGRPRGLPTYDELVATGDLALIRDQELLRVANLMASATVFNRVTQQGSDAAYRRAFRMIIPTKAHRAVRRDCGDRITIVGDYESIIGSLQYRCTLNLGAEDIAAAAAILRNDAEIIPMLRLRIAEVETQLGDLAANPDMVEGLRKIAGR